jgi:hypothetical protein
VHYYSTLYSTVALAVFVLVWVVSGFLFDFGGDLLIGCVLDSIGGVLLVQLCCQAVGAWVRWISVAVCLSSVCSKSQREVFRITLSSSRSADNE